MKKQGLAVIGISVFLSALIAMPAAAEFKRTYFRMQNETLNTDHSPVVIGEPVAYIPLSGNQQYEINIFLSNFAEQYFGGTDYFDVAAPNINDLVFFCHIYTKLNTDYPYEYKKIPDKRWGEVSYEVYSLEQFNKVLDRFLGIRFTDDEVRAGYADEEHSFYRDSHFYFTAADGETYSRFAVANTMYLDTNGNYVVDFDIYQLSFDLYWKSGTVEKKYYALSPVEAQNTAGLSKVASGRAAVVPFQYNGRDTYRINAYYVAGQ